MEKALDEGYMDMFLYEEISREDTIKVFYITIYCDYNSSKQQMAECTSCKNWFHQECQQIFDKVSK